MTSSPAIQVAELEATSSTLAQPAGRGDGGVEATDRARQAAAGRRWRRRANPWPYHGPMSDEDADDDDDGSQEQAGVQLAGQRGADEEQAMPAELPSTTMTLDMTASSNTWSTTNRAALSPYAASTPFPTAPSSHAASTSKLASASASASASAYTICGPTLAVSWPATTTLPSPAASWASHSPPGPRLGPPHRPVAHELMATPPPPRLALASPYPVQPMYSYAADAPRAMTIPYTYAGPPPPQRSRSSSRFSLSAARKWLDRTSQELENRLETALRGPPPPPYPPGPAYPAGPAAAQQTGNFFRYA